MRSVYNAILAFFGPVPTAIRGFVNLDELTRVMLTAVGASSIVALLGTLLAAIGANAATIFPNAAVAVVVTFVCSHLIDFGRRLGHGPEAIAMVPIDRPSALGMPDALSARPGTAESRGPDFSGLDVLQAYHSGILSRDEIRSHYGLPILIATKLVSPEIPPAAPGA